MRSYDKTSSNFISARWIFRAIFPLGAYFLAANPCLQIRLNFGPCLKSNSIKDIQLNVTVENISLPSSDTMKVLGIDIDDRLTFDGHISNMCIKAGRQLNVLQRLKGSLDQDSRMAIYKSFIMSNFNYCPLITCQNLHFGKYVRLSVCYLPKFTILASMFVCRFVCLSVRFVKHNS